MYDAKIDKKFRDLVIEVTDHKTFVALVVNDRIFPRNFFSKEQKSEILKAAAPIAAEYYASQFGGFFTKVPY